MLPTGTSHHYQARISEARFYRRAMFGFRLTSSLWRKLRVLFPCFTMLHFCKPCLIPFPFPTNSLTRQYRRHSRWIYPEAGVTSGT